MHRAERFLVTRQCSLNACGSGLALLMCSRMMSGLAWQLRCQKDWGRDGFLILTCLLPQHPSYGVRATSLPPVCGRASSTMQVSPPSLASHTGSPQFPSSSPAVSLSSTSSAAGARSRALGLSLETPKPQQRQARNPKMFKSLKVQSLPRCNGAPPRFGVSQFGARQWHIRDTDTGRN